MTHAEIKAAFMDECPVMFNGVRYITSESR